MNCDRLRKAAVTSTLELLQHRLRLLSRQSFPTPGSSCTRHTSPKTRLSRHLARPAMARIRASFGRSERPKTLETKPFRRVKQD